MMEVIGNHGRVVITTHREKKGQIDAVEAFATGGTAKLAELTVHPLESIWKE